MDGVGDKDGVRVLVGVGACDGVWDADPDWDGVALTVTVTDEIMNFVMRIYVEFARATRTSLRDGLRNCENLCR